MLTIDTPIGTPVRAPGFRDAGELTRVEVFEFGDPLFFVRFPGMLGSVGFDYDELSVSEPPGKETPDADA